MPIYEYVCKECDSITETLVGINERPKKVECEECGSKDTERKVSTFAMGQGPTNEFRKQHDEARREMEMRSELKETYGVEKVNVLPNSEGKGFKETYSDIKDRGSMVRDQMQTQRELNQKKTKKKQRKWMEGALKRTPKRREELSERKKKEAFEKRSIKPLT